MAIAQSTDIRAIFFDVDGTLISLENHKMPISTREALFALRAQGVKLFVATGRSKMLMPFMDQYFSFDGYITLNGQYCYGKHGVMRKQTIAAPQIEKLCQLIEENPFACLFVEEDSSFLNYTDDHAKALYRLLNEPEPSSLGLSRVRHHEVLQFVPFLPDSQMYRLQDTLENVVYMRSVDVCLDVMATGGGKEKGIAAVLAHENIAPEQAMAFGDSFNDIGMLNYVGTGVAMGNARDEVKQVANFVTRRVEDDGIAYALRTLGVLP